MGERIATCQWFIPYLYLVPIQKPLHPFGGVSNVFLLRRTGVDLSRLGNVVVVGYGPDNVIRDASIC